MENYGQTNSQGFYPSDFTMNVQEQQQQNPPPPQQQWGAGGQQYYPPLPSSAAGYTMYSQGWSGDTGHVEQMEVTPSGSLGQISGGVQYGAQFEGGDSGAGFEDELPLMQELGIDFKVIKENTLTVLNPLQTADANSLRNTDLAGPLLFCLLFGGILLLSGKVHFGYIYGVGVIGCMGLFAVLNLMSTGGVSVSCVVSVLGYCLLPMVLLSAASVILSLQGIVGTVLSVAIICWCSFSASKLFVSVLNMHSQQLLVAYPCALLYGVFALLTVF